MLPGLLVCSYAPGTVSLDGTRIAANASKHAALSHEWAGQEIARLELEVQQLPAKAEQADATPLHEGLTLPGEIARRQERKAALEQTNLTDPDSRIMKSSPSSRPALH